MRNNISLIKCSITVTVATILSYLYGVITVQYNLFPYRQLHNIYHMIMPVHDDNRSYSDYFYQRKSFFDKHGEHRYDIVFIGDSHIDGAEWEDLFPALKIANRGIGGDRTDGILKRMDSIYSTNAGKAFIMIGRNDISVGAKVSDVLNNYKIIIAKLVAHGMQVYVQSIILQGNRKAELNKNIKLLNIQLKNMADENRTFTYIDLNEVLASGEVLDPRFTIDDVHLNGDGYAVWKKIINKYVQ